VGDSSKTAVVDRGGRRVRFYIRRDSSRPGQQERRAMAAQGKKWCRGCEDWLRATEVNRGVCRIHANQAYRDYYAGAGKASISQRVHARKRGVSALPAVAMKYLLEQFNGLCAYCQRKPADTWDHIQPVKIGGQTEPGNIVPACLSCNSSKKDRDVIEWANEQGISLTDVQDVMILEEI
jgi:hypothetical protein